MSFNTLLYLRTISKAKKSLCPPFIILNSSSPFPMIARKQEACHAL